VFKKNEVTQTYKKYMTNWTTLTQDELVWLHVPTLDDKISKKSEDILRKAHKNPPPRKRHSLTALMEGDGDPTSQLAMVGGCNKNTCFDDVRVYDQVLF
jgi:hypothetical protein